MDTTTNHQQQDHHRNNNHCNRTTPKNSSTHHKITAMQQRMNFVRGMDNHNHLQIILTVVLGTVMGTVMGRAMHDNGQRMVVEVATLGMVRNRTWKREKLRLIIQEGDD
jgi:hypothetical protein